MQQIATYTIEGYYHGDIKGTLTICMHIVDGFYCMYVLFSAPNIEPEYLKEIIGHSIAEKALKAYRKLKRTYYAPLCATIEYITVLGKQIFQTSLK